MSEIAVAVDAPRTTRRVPCAARPCPDDAVMSTNRRPCWIQQSNTQRSRADDRDVLLMRRALLDPAWSAFGAKAPAVWQRPLHAHQHEALTRSENFLVATGTGSGKTESFLYPLVDDILRQGDLDRPGVRAILVYPLNALANDQLNRIAALLYPRPRRSRHHARALYRPGEGPRHPRRGDHPAARFAELHRHLRRGCRGSRPLAAVAGGDAGDPAAHPDHQLCDARAHPAPAEQPAAAGPGGPALDRARRDPHLCRRAGDRGLLPAPAAEGASRSARRPGALRRDLRLARSGPQEGARRFRRPAVRRAVRRRARR